jgi:hypothetical protein
MAIVRGDRIAESRSLNARSIEVQEFYSALVGKVPDDFGRFRREPSHVAIALYPRRELTQALLRRTGRMLDILEKDTGGDGAPLFDAWVCDGVRFAQLRKWKAHGNRYHRTPEPPGSDHVHTLTCFPTAIARARDWHGKEAAAALSVAFRSAREQHRAELEARRRSGMAEGSSPQDVRQETDNGNDVVVADNRDNELRERERSGGGARVPSPSPPSPSSPSSTSLERKAAAAGDEQSHPLAPDRPALEAECLRLVREIAALRNVDPTEVMGEAGEWNGRRQLNPSAMKIDRLMNTVLDLRRMRAGQPAHAPPANARAQERKAGMAAVVQGGLDARRSVGDGDDRAGRELPGPGPGSGGPEGARRGLPPGAGEPDR